MSTFDEKDWRETCDRADGAAKKAKEKAKRRDLYDVLGVSRDATDKFGFRARNLGTTKQQREKGGGKFEDLFILLFTKVADLLVKIAREESELFHDADGSPYANALVGGHRETYHVRGRSFALWLRKRFYEKYDLSPNTNAVSEALDTIVMFAVCKGPELPVHVRTAEHGRAIFIDLGDKDWRAVKVTAASWEVVADPPVRFVRSGSMRPLPLPVKGGSIEALRRFINVRPRDEVSGADEFVLLVAYALAALRPNCSYPALILAGEQGSGKTSLVRLLGSLIDPRSPQLRSLPGNERDLIVAARHAHFIAFDNISGLADGMSDAICRLSTGGGHGERRLYTNEEEATFEGRRPVCLNGIEDVATRPDLVDRALMLPLLAIGPDDRRDEKDLEREFAAEASAIFGALLDGLVSGLLNLADVKVVSLPRMADFALWSEACTLAYWPAAGTFMRAYRENIAAANSIVIEASAVGDAVRNFMSGRIKWEGTASELLQLLTRIIPEPLARERSWPKTARALSGKLRRAAAPLRKIGIDVAFVREGHDRERIIVITATRVEKAEDSSSAPSAGTGKSEKPRQDKGLGADANADGMRTQTANADANADANDGRGRKADGMRTQESEQPSAANHWAGNGFSRNADDADDADANSATTFPSPDERVCVRCGVPGGPVHGQLIRAGQDGATGHYHPRCWTEERTKGPLRRREVPPDRRPGLGPAGDSLDDFK
jgi:energy-coupling factor transporter ATP-binding protein EcfA2